MITNIRVILMLLAIVCLFLAAIGVQTPRGGSLLAGGLCLWALATILTS